MLHNNFFCKGTVGQSKAPLLLQKEKCGSGKSGVSKVLFTDIGKITNCQKPELIQYIEMSLIPYL